MNEQLSTEEIAVRNAEAIHDMCMDKDDPIRAAMGRCLKYVNPACEAWIHSEHDRRTQLSEIIIGASEAMGLLIGSMVSAASKRVTDSAEQYEARWKLGIELAIMSFTFSAKANPNLEKKGTPTNERT